MMKPETVLINDWIAKNGGARKFKQGEGSNFRANQFYLAEKGIQVSKKGHRYHVKRPNGRTKTYNERGLADLVDELRVADGKQPFKIKNLQ